MKKIALATTASAILLCASAASAQENYLSQIMPVGGKNCPKGWLVADGALLPIKQNSLLYSLLGTTYGGDGKNTFAIPNLKGGTIGPAAQPITWCIATTGVFPPRP